jgi:hypothetical protein
MALHVVRLPQAREVRALEQEFVDEVGEVRGVGVGAGEGAKPGDAAADLVLPVVEERAGGGVEEDVAHDVALLLGPVLQPGHQAQTARIGGDHVHGAADHVRGMGPHALQQQLDTGIHRAAGMPGAAGRRRQPRDGARGARGEVAQMLAFGPVQPEGGGEGVDHGRARIGLLAPLQTRVVVDADPRERGQLLAAQFGRAEQPGALRQTDVGGRHPGAAGAAGAQEVPQSRTAFATCAAAVLLTCHAMQCGSAVTWSAVAWGPCHAPNRSQYDTVCRAVAEASRLDTSRCRPRSWSACC